MVLLNVRVTRFFFTVISKEQTQLHSLCSTVPAQFYMSNENGIFHWCVACYLSELRWPESFPVSALSQITRFCFSKVQFQITVAKTLTNSFQKILLFFNVNFNIWIPRNISSCNKYFISIRKKAKYFYQMQLCSTDLYSFAHWSKRKKIM